MNTGSELILMERQRQIDEERLDELHDAKHVNGELAIAGALYALHASKVIERKHRGVFAEGATINKRCPILWPFEAGWWKPNPEEPVLQLVKAGALIAAEIDRLQNADADGGVIEEPDAETT